MRSRFVPLTLANALMSSGVTNSRYWFENVMRTRSAHGYRLAEKHTDGSTVGLTRISNCHCSSSLSSVLTHSSGFAIHPSRSFGLRGMNRVTRNVTAVSTKSWERAEDMLVRTNNELARHSLKVCSVFVFRVGAHWARLSLNKTIPATRMRTGNTAVSESKRY
jgi:hypothetical protein